MSEGDLVNGILCPPLDQLKNVSFEVAKRVGDEAVKAGVIEKGCTFSRYKHKADPDRLNLLIEKMRWEPQYFNQS